MRLSPSSLRYKAPPKRAATLSVTAVGCGPELPTRTVAPVCAWIPPPSKKAVFPVTLAPSISTIAPPAAAMPPPALALLPLTSDPASRESWPPLTKTPPPMPSATTLSISRVSTSSSRLAGPPPVKWMAPPSPMWLVP